MSRLAMTIALSVGLASLSACSKDASKEEAAKLDETLLGKGKASDPALTAALEDQIMVDPSLATQSNAHAVRSADQPLQAPIPTEAAGGPAPPSAKTLGQRVAEQSPGPAPGASYPKTASLAAAQVPSAKPSASASPVAVTGKAKLSQASFSGCGLAVSYSMAWSARMPADLPLYPQAKVSEAAGSDSGVCRLRAVTFSSSAAPRNLIDYYLTTARNAGYQADLSNANGEQMVAGNRADGAAFYIIITPRTSGGTIADLVANRGA
jgi:hypothetical protein